MSSPTVKEKSEKHKKGFTFSKLREAFSLHKKEEQSGQNQSVTFCPLVEHDENVLNKFFAIKQGCRFGIPGIISVLAYDTVQRIMAIGTSTGSIVVFGQVGVERYFELNSVASKDQTDGYVPSPRSKYDNDRRNPVKCLKFKQGSGLLISIDGRNQVVGWNLVNGLADFVVDVGEQVTYFDLPCGMDVGFMGTISGKVLVLNCERGNLSQEFIPCPENHKSIPVSFCITHPQFPTQILIGYNSRLIVLWSHAEKKVLKSFTVNSSDLYVPQGRSADDISVTCASWKPDGSHFVAGFDNGQFAFWNKKNDKALSVKFVSGYRDNYSLDPVYQIEWCCSLEQKDSSWIIVSGGNVSGESLRGVRIFEIGNDIADMKSYKAQHMIGIENDDINCFIVTPTNSPWANQQLDPAAIFLITSSGYFRAYDITLKGFPPMSGFNTLNFYNQPLQKLAKFALGISAMDFFKLKDFQLQSAEGQPSKTPLPMVCGGIPGVSSSDPVTEMKVLKSFRDLTIQESPEEKDDGKEEAEYDTELLDIPNPPSDMNDILLLANEQNQIVFWEIGATLKPMDYLTLDSHFAEGEKPKINYFEFVEEDSMLVVCYDAKSVTAYKLSERNRTEESQDKLRKEKLNGIIIEEVSTTCSSGFQPVFTITLKDISIDATFTITKYDPKIRLFFIGLSTGDFWLLNIGTFKIIHHEKILLTSSTEDSGKGDLRPDIVTKVVFSSVFVPLKDLNVEPVSPTLLMLVGTESGCIYAYQIELVNMADNAVVPIVARSKISESPSKAVFLSIIDSIEGKRVVADDLVHKTDKPPTPVDPEATEPKKNKKAKGGSADSLNHDKLKTMETISETRYYTIVCHKSCIKILKNVSQKVDYEISLEGIIMAANLVDFMGQVFLVAILEDATVNVHSLPTLKQLFKHQISYLKLSKDDEIDICKDGRITILFERGDLQQFYIFHAEKRRNVPLSLGLPYDTMLQIPSRPNMDVLMDNKQQFLGTIKKAFTGALLWTNDQDWAAECDDLKLVYNFKAKESTQRKQNNVEGTMKSQAATSHRNEREELMEGAEEVSNTSDKKQNAFLDARNNLAERGEKLQRLDDKFANLADQSKDFLETIREYNKKQQEKKWYEF